MFSFVCGQVSLFSAFPHFKHAYLQQNWDILSFISRITMVLPWLDYAVFTLSYRTPFRSFAAKFLASPHRKGFFTCFLAKLSCF